MNLKAFSVFDQKVGAFMPPIFYQTTGQAERAFGDAVKDDTTGIAKHPEDYSLHSIGEFDQDRGVFLPREHGPEIVCHATIFLRKD